MLSIIHALIAMAIGTLIHFALSWMTAKELGKEVFFLSSLFAYALIYWIENRR